MPKGAAQRVLVIGDDIRIFLAIVRAFGRAGKEVHVVPFSTPLPALKSRYISKLHAVPDYDSDQSGWEEAVLILLGRESFDIVIPVSDWSILFLDQHREELAHQKISIPGEEAMLGLFDKEETHRLCEALDVPAAPAARLSATDSADELIARYGIPFVLKPRRSFWVDRGQTGDKVEIIENKTQLIDVLATVPDRSRYIAEGFFKGSGIGVSVLAAEGRIVQAFQHRRLREGRAGASSYRISEAVDPTMREACEKICRRVNYTGVCMFEFRLNRNSGDWVLLETNARFWGSMPLPLSLGIDFPNLLYDLTVDHRQREEPSYALGIRSRNFMMDGKNLVKNLKQTRAAGIVAWLLDVGDFALQPLRWLSGRERSDSFVGDDLAPAFAEFGLLFTKLKKPKSRLPASVSPRRAY